MTTSTRFYIVNDDNASWICDGTTGKCVAEARVSDRAAVDALPAKAAGLNAADYSSRRQFGESRAAFAARTAAA